MQIARLEEMPNREIDAHGSQGARIFRLLAAAGRFSIVQLQLGPHGQLGMHPAAQDQLLLVLEGGGWAQAADSEPAEVTSGSLVLWRSGENHATSAGPAGLVALIVEADSLTAALRGPGKRPAPSDGMPEV